MATSEVGPLEGRKPRSVTMVGGDAYFDTSSRHEYGNNTVNAPSNIGPGNPNITITNWHAASK